MPLHKPYKDDGAGGWVPQALTKELTNVSDVVKLLSLAENRKDGISKALFEEQGWCSMPAIYTELRGRGYEIEVFWDDGDEERMRLLEHPAAGAKRRKKDQMSLLGDVRPMNPLNS